jgi:curved DNA-binding protein CbpA
MVSAEPNVGHLPQGGFAGLLRDLMRKRASGRLDVVTLGDRRQLWFDAGSVQAVASDAEAEKLGTWLVAEGLLEPARMALSLLRQPDGVRYGTFLVREGLIDADRLSMALAGLAVTIVSKLLVPVATYMFVDGEPLPDDAATLDMTCADLLAAAVRRSEDLAGLETLLPAESFPTGVEDALMQFQRVQLSPQEAFLLSRIDGTMTVSQVRRVVPLPHGEMTRCLASLTATGLVTLRHEPGAPPATADAGPVPAAPIRQADPGESGMQFTAEQRREFEEIAKLAADCRQRDFYRRLGLAHGATLNQVHERYREFVRMYHPDRAREPHLRSLRRELAEIHGAIGEAYETLVNQELRARYNESLKANTVQSPEERLQDDRRLRARRELARANEQRAQALIRAGDFGAAVQLLDEAVRAEPTADSLLLLARLEQRNPMWSNRVLDHLRMAVTMDPQFTDGWLELASFWGRKGQKERQRQCLEKVIGYDPLNADALRLLAPFRTNRK